MMNSLATQRTGSCGAANNIFNTLEMPTTTFSSQNRNSNGKISQRNTNTPTNGTRFDATSAITEGRSQSMRFKTALISAGGIGPEQ